MTSPAQDCRLPGPSLVTARQRRMTCAAHCWMPASRSSRCWYPVYPSVISAPVNSGRDPGGDGGLAP